MERADALRAGSQFFRLEEHVFADKTISLDHLEQKIIRPVFKEPRIHVALVCAARSCPAIRGEAYIGSRIEAQLQDQATQFANNLTYVEYDSVGDSLKLSPLLKWYSEDWDAQGGYLVWLSKLVKNESTRDKLLAAGQGQVKVDFKTYDWTLNSQTGSGSSSSGKDSGGFGSGSVPNE